MSPGSATVQAWAPGRLNIVGEHTDYNGGLALPASVPLGVLAAARPARGGRVEARSNLYAAPASVSIDGDDPQGPFGHALAGVARALCAFGLTPPAASIELHSDLPPGAGLSSSAALSVALLEVLAALAETTLSAAELVELAREAERLGTGVRCGALDPTAIVYAAPGHATRVDFATGTVERIPLQLRAAELVVIDTGMPRALAATGYNERRAACERAVQHLRERGWPALRALGEILPEALAPALDALPPELHGVVRHVVTENERVRRACAALAAPDVGARAKRLGSLLDASHASLRDHYEVSLPAIDRLLEAVRAAGARGARIMGAGFGGSCLALVDGRAGIDAVKEALRALGAPPASTPRVIELGTGLGTPRWVRRAALDEQRDAATHREGH